MRDRVSWPKIIAAFVAGFGVSAFFSSWTLTFGGGGTRIGCEWRAMVICALLLLMSYPLATGREWARRLLLFAVVVVGVGFVVYYAFRVVSPMGFTDLSAEQIKVVRLWTRLTDLSSFFVAATLFIFGAYFLSHKDVVASFSRAPSPEKV